MNKLSAFSTELEKIAKIKVPAAVVTGGIGASIGAKRGFKGALDDQWKDDDRLRAGLISQQEWKDRKTFRIARGSGSTAAGAITGASIPRLAGKARKWMVDSATEAAKPLGDQFERSSKNVADHTRKELDRSLDRANKKLLDGLEERSEQVGEGLGRGAKKGVFGDGKTSSGGFWSRFRKKPQD